MDFIRKRTTESIITQEGRFLGNFIALLMKVGLSLMRNVLMPLAESVFTPLELAAAPSATDATIQKKT